MKPEPPTRTEALACPRCTGAVLVPAAGSALLDAPCPRCGGTFVSPAGVQRLIHDEHGIDIQTLRELMGGSAGTRLSCPACSYAMSHVQLKGVALELCTGCGGVWLDEGELLRLSSGRYRYQKPVAPELPAAEPAAPVGTTTTEPSDADLEPASDDEPKEISGRHGGRRASGNRMGCMQAAAMLYAGGFGVAMVALGLSVGWQLTAIGVAALAVVVVVVRPDSKLVRLLGALGSGRRAIVLFPRDGPSSARGDVSSPAPSAPPPETPSERS